jgi:Tannase and feruloyl esterase
MRNRKIYLQSAAAVAAATLGFAVSPAKADSCSNLASSFHRPNTTITTAQTIPAGTFNSPAGALPNLPQFCRIAGFTAPTSDSHINFEVWVPETGWNLKYMQVGCGGYCGSITYVSLADALRRGYATAGTDDGNQAGNASFGLGHPEKVIDFGYRAIKETTDVAKGLIVAFENSGPQHSYFVGCSDGGREARMEAQRFPQDFDGIIAGSPASFWTHLMTGFAWNVAALEGISGGDLSQSDLDALSKSALAQCVGKDGGLSSDQFLNNPLACHFNPKKLSLSKDKIEAIEKIFSGPRGIFPGYRVGEGEANLAVNWPTWITDSGNPAAGLQSFFATTTFQNLVFPNSGWTPTTFTAEENAEAADKAIGSIINSTDTDLRAFKAHGGKLIQYVGWSDTAISPQSDIDFFHALNQEMGEKDTQEFYRLFMAPGMAHCGGGPGANAFGQGFGIPSANPSDPTVDVVAALDHWVVNGRVPNQINATKFVNDNPAQGIAFQRPLCPFPQFAKYNGTGSTTSAASFACVKPDHDDDDGQGHEEASNR